MLNWYLQTGKDSDVVIASKIKLSRNLSQFNFYIKEEQEILKLENLIQENLLQIGYNLKFLKLRNLGNNNMQVLIEKGIISQKEVLNKNKAAILINEEENICIIINSEEHFEIQVFTSGLDIDAITNLCIEIDEKLQKIFNISKSAKYGYLTACPTNVGTGMKLSVILHLPGLTKTKNIHKVIKFVRQFGIEITKYEEPDIYKISNERTLGVTEEDIINSLKAIAEKIIEQEKTARKVLVENPIELEDHIFRSYGVLSNCRKISQDEAKELLSDVKLGVDLGIIKELTDSKIKKLYLYTNPANLNKYFGQELNLSQQNIKRAEVIKQITKE